MMIKLLDFNSPEAKSHQPVLHFFDSGIGGMALLEKVLEVHPNLNFVYTADGELFPYGSQTLETIENRLYQLINRLKANYPQFKNFILACNTATCATAGSIEQQGFSFKVINPVDEVTAVLKARFVATQKPRVLLIATPATVSSNLYSHKLGSEFELLQHPTTQLARASEEGWASGSLEMQTVLAPIKEAINQFNPQAIILGSTHYSWVSSCIEPLAPKGCVVLDTAACMAESVLRLVSNKLLTGETQHVLNTKSTPYFEQFALNHLNATQLSV